ncbi:MAG: diguanylate cyclase [Planctomycetaceae bacterium]|nr:diguanylate cyclase [Planctomycetaceae bacterium]
MSYSAGVIKAIKERNREELLRLFIPMCNEYKVDTFTVTDNEGNVLIRSYEPEFFGDSITNQQNIKDALNGRTTSYFESGTLIRISTRTGVPVYDTDGTLIGVVSAAIRFDSDKKVENLKELFSAEIAFFLDGVRIASTVTKDGHCIVGTTLEPKIEEIVVKNKQEYIGTMSKFGERYATYYKPLLDSQDNVFAVFFFGMPKTDLLAASYKVIRDGTIFGLLGLIISAVFIHFIMSSISEPIIMLSKNMSNIADGDLDVDIKISSEDEVGDLGRSLQRIANILHKMLTDIDTMINEHKKGNTNYSLNSDAFRGDYRILVNSVLELANTSMKDQLTGISNRRSFDNRMELEWHRAIRDKTPTSILFVDVDNFKMYNDTFGHQQGDVALKSVANVLNQSLSRSTDFAARWGGEEFMVLLPNTISTGAVRVAEAIRAAIEKTVITCDDERGRKITVSIGINTFVPEQGCQIDTFILGADEALYKAKMAGKNRTWHHYEKTQD